VAIIYCDKAERVADILPPESVQTVVTSPPYYGLRDYGVEGQIGLEATPEEYVEKLVEVFRGIRQVLRPDGTVWLNLGDSYNGSGGAGGDYNEGGLKEGQPRYPGRRVKGLKPKDLIGIPWRVAFALQADGWYLRSDIIWHKPNPMPESVKDRPTKAHEYVFLLSKSPRYYYDAEAIAEPAVSGYRGSSFTTGKTAATKPNVGQKPRMERPTRNKRSVWTIATQPYPEAHFATFPEKLVEPCILAGTSPKACPKCRAPWVRVVKSEPMVIKRSDRAEKMGKFGRTQPSGTMVAPPHRETVGWEPTCDCPDNDGSGKCIVLDPFAGSGTTLLVAERLGREGVGIEINPEYVEMAKRRLSKMQLSMSL